jgi:hypothetical protein
MITTEILDALNRQYRFITGSDLATNDINDIRALSSEIGSDEYKLSEHVLARASHVRLERYEKSNENLIQSIDKRFSNFASADIEKMSDKLRDELEGIAVKTNSIVDHIQNRTEFIISQNALSIIDQISQHAEDELFRNVVSQINERVNIAVSKTVKRMWLLLGCVLGGSIGVLVTWVLHHPSIFK